MTEDESLQRAIHDEVALVAHDPGWAQLFEAERGRLLALFPQQLLGVEHVGSTAIDGMPAKPVIDVLAGVASMDVADALTGALLASGYTTSAEFNSTLIDRRWFMRWAAGRRTHHLHVVVHHSDEWHRRLRFRDVLKADPVLAGRYASLKKTLALQYPADREAYTAAKTAFVLEVLGRA